MLNTEKFTEKALEIIDSAVRSASEMGHTYVGSEHILYAMVSEGDSAAADYLFSCGLDAKCLYNEIVRMVGRGSPSKLSQRYFTSALKKILEDSYINAVSENKRQSTPEYILYSIIRCESCSGAAIMRKRILMWAGFVLNCGMLTLTAMSASSETVQNLKSLNFLTYLSMAEI